MNTEIIVHPKLMHYGLATANLDTMVDWYRKVLGMTVNNRVKVPAGIPNGPPFSGMAFVSNDEFDHRIVFFEIPGLVADPDKRRHTGLQHVAFEFGALDEMLGTYTRLKKAGIPPIWAADHGVGTSIYYEDPEKNVVELNVDNFGNRWTATEFLKAAAAAMPVQIDLDKMIAARKEGASAWELHERAFTGEFTPEETFNPGTRF